jgi:predicted RNA-binding Zn-ribbon protein involved in translation (DUF1610 family)
MPHVPVAIRYTKRVCPYCGHAFGIIFDRSAIRLGTGTRVCDDCGEVFNDGSVEWPELALDQKRRFLFGGLRWLAFCIGGPMLMVIFSGIGHPEDGQFTPMVLRALLAFGIALLCVFYLICGVHIWRSKRRFAAKESTTQD